MYNTSVKVPFLDQDGVDSLLESLPDGLADFVTIPLLDTSERVSRAAVERTRQLLELSYYERVGGVSSVVLDPGGNSWTVELTVVEDDATDD